MKMYELFLTCPKGLEKICKKEIEDIGIKAVQLHDGGISLDGSMEDIYRVNHYSRTGMNLLVKLLDFSFSDIKTFYDFVYNYKWHTIIHPKSTFSINSNIIQKNSIFNNSQFASLKIKDAICDRIRKSKGRRPEIDKKNPQISIRSIIDKTSCTIYINSSGNPLYMRGYKKNQHKASINESLASGLIFLSEWDKKTAFLDPMCGSGTIPLEACMIKKRIPAGINRTFAFQNWLNYDQDLYQIIVKKSIDLIDEESKADIFGTDINADYINDCKSNAQSFQFNLGLNFKLKNINNFNQEKKYHIVTNPPYEIRIGDEQQIKRIHQGLKNLLKLKSSIYLIYPEDSDFIKNQYNFTKLSSLYNGPIKCGFYRIKSEK